MDEKYLAAILGAGVNNPTPYEAFLVAHETHADALLTQTKRLTTSQRVVRLGGVGVGVLVAFQLVGAKNVMALLLGCAAVIVAHSLAASIALGGGVVNASARLIRLITAMIAKWMVILLCLLGGIFVCRFSVVALIVGMSVGLVYQIVNLFKLAR